jgi:hypothetical protein
VAAYGFYAPTGAPGGLIAGLGNGYWTHEFSAGGTAYFDRKRRWKLTALASYEHNQPKRDLDFRRGDTLQIQGGAGFRIVPMVDLGVAGYALWQVADDAGSAVPPALAGARDIDYGLGPEINVWVPKLHTRLIARYTHDAWVRTRPNGELVLIELQFQAWMAKR